MNIQDKLYIIGAGRSQKMEIDEERAE